MKQVSEKLCVASNLKNNKRKQQFQILTIHRCWENFEIILLFAEKMQVANNLYAKNRLEMKIYLQILLQSYP